MSRYPVEWENSLLVTSGLDSLLTNALLNELRDLHNAEGRFYHNWDHALDVLQAVLRLPLPEDKLRAYALAAVFHDAVYVYGHTDNESNSVVLMESRIHRSKLVDSAASLIMYTSMHLRSSVDNIPPYERDFLDCDMLSIGSSCWPIALAYDRAVYEEAKSAGRSSQSIHEDRMRFFNSMMDKPSIFLGQHYGSTHEWQARQNIHRLRAHHYKSSQ